MLNHKICEFMRAAQPNLQILRPSLRPPLSLILIIIKPAPALHPKFTVGNQLLQVLSRLGRNSRAGIGIVLLDIVDNVQPDDLRARHTLTRISYWWQANQTYIHLLERTQACF